VVAEVVEVVEVVEEAGRMVVTTFTVEGPDPS
jgi:hypothetical protein